MKNRKPPPLYRDEKVFADSAALDADTAIKAAEFAKKQADKLEAATAQAKQEEIRAARVELARMEPRGLASLSPRKRLVATPR